MQRPHSMAHRSRIRRVLGPVAAAIALGGASTASACIDVGVYRDNPQASFNALQKSVGPGVNVISTYVSLNQRVDPALIRFAKARKARLLVTLMADGGRDGVTQPSYTNAAISSGRYDRRVRDLARQLKASGLQVVLRPMPEPNTQFYPWSGTVNGNSPASYIAAWKRIRTVVKKNGGKRIKLLWAPYARSVPDTDDNAIDQYFPGDDSVDLVGVSGYNFGTVGELEWLTPTDLFQDPYIEIKALSRKAFWIAETGTTASGGDKARWLRELAQLQKSMPALRAVVLYDIKEPAGDFRISGNKQSRAATKAILATRCGKKPPKKPKR